MTIKDFFQIPYNWIKAIKTPEWLKLLLAQVQDLLWQIITNATKAFIENMTAYIIEAASHKDWSSSDKREYVFEKAKKGAIELGITIRDSAINLLIEVLVAQLKKSGVIA
jgi:hypothetical protein